MKAIQRVIHAGFATAALASASLPAMSWTVWPDVDFAWYADVGKPATATLEAFPAPRAGYIWAPGHYEWSGARQNWVAGHWIRDDYSQQVASYAVRGSTFATGPMTLRDRDGNVISTDPSAYPVDSTRR